LRIRHYLIKTPSWKEVVKTSKNKKGIGSEVQSGRRLETFQETGGKNEEATILMPHTRVTANQSYYAGSRA
ncbi:hypothetical protein, partial [Klebsiella pneumoniae]|uniref:hypothetical protein n=1 Tax=Klebsiella pneumoniae TaxID=573 RepID=UPI00405564C7